MQSDLLVSDEASDRKAAPAHAVHETASQTLPAATTLIAVRVHGDGLGASTHEGVLATPAKGRLEAWSGSHVDVLIKVNFLVESKIKACYAGRLFADVDCGGCTIGCEQWRFP